MNQKTLNTLLAIAGAGLGVAGLIFILFSIFTEKNTLIWGLLCVALGTLFSIIRLLWGQKALHQSRHFSNARRFER